MKNAIFIHAANMSRDVRGLPNEGRCQQILDRIALFIKESKIYEDVDAIHLGYVGDKGLRFDVPKAVITYHTPDIYTWEFPTLHQLRSYCQENKDSNVLYIHTQGVSQGYHHHEFKKIEHRRDYLLYWNIIRYKEILEYLKTYDTCGAMLVPLNADLRLDDQKNPHIERLHDNPVWHYSQNFWWSRASHINTLPDPETYPLILDKRHQAEFWLCSSTENGTHGCIHNLYNSWCYAEDFSPQRYMDKEMLNKFYP